MMLEQKATDFLNVLSSKEPTPGGGGASAAVGAFAAALGMMVTNLTVGKKKYADVEEEIIGIRSQLEELKERLIFLTDKDAEAFEPLAKAYSMPKGTPEEIERKEEVMESALYEASMVPLEIVRTVFEVFGLLKVLEKKGSRLAVSDVGVAVLFARAALEGASLNIYINTKLMKDQITAQRIDKKAEDMIRQGQEYKDRIYSTVMSQIR